MGRHVETPAHHEERILRMLEEDGPLTEKAVAGGLANWWTRSDCYDALRRLIKRGEVVEIDGLRKRRFALKTWADRWRR